MVPERAEGPLAGVLAKGPLRVLVAKRSRKYAILLRRSGKVGNPMAMATGSVKKTIITCAVMTPSAVVSAILLNPLMILFCLLPLALYFAPELALKDRVAARKEGIERELPFFSVLMNVLGGAGVPLYAILQSVLGSEKFSSVRNEALIVRRYVGIFGMNPDDSLDRLATDHPSRKFSDFLVGYTSKARSGGDVPAFLSEESGTQLREIEDAWSSYASRVGVVGSMMVTVFGVVPLLLMVVGVFSPGFSLLGLIIFAGVGVPLFTTGLVFMAGRMQPMGEEPVRGRLVRSLGIALLGLCLFPITGAVWLTLALVLTILFTAYGLSTKKQLAETNRIDEGLSRFLKDLLEYKRQEYDLTKAVLAIQANTEYNPYFDKALSKVASQIRAGVPLDEVKLECRSRLADLVFLVVGQMSRSGGGTVDTAYQLSHYTERMVQMKRNARVEIKPYLVLSYISPVLLAFGVTFVGQVLLSFNNPLHPAVAGLQVAGADVRRVSPELAQVSDFLIVCSAAALGLIGAKITDLTIRNTLRASTNVGLAVVAVVCMTYVASHSLGALVG